MKTKRLIPGLLLTLALAAVLVLPGCSSDPNKPSKFRNMFYSAVQTPKPAVTNLVAEYQPQDVITPARTNEATGVITPPTVRPGALPTNTQWVIMQPPPGTTWEVNPQAVGSVQAIGGLVPGWGTVAVPALGFLFAMGRIWLNRKDKPIIASTFQQIDLLRQGLLASGDAKMVKLAAEIGKLLEKGHQAAGVEDAVRSLINQYTATTGDAQKIADIARGTPVPAGV